MKRCQAAHVTAQQNLNSFVKYNVAFEFVSAAVQPPVEIKQSEKQLFPSACQDDGLARLSPTSASQQTWTFTPPTSTDFLGLPSTIRVCVCVQLLLCFYFVQWYSLTTAIKRKTRRFWNNEVVSFKILCIYFGYKVGTLRNGISISVSSAHVMV